MQRQVKSVAELEGRVLTEVRQSVYKDNDAVIFTLDDGGQFMLSHDQDCCESVSVESLSGDFEDLVGEPLFIAEVRTAEGPSSEYGDTSTWTFYTFSTIKGTVDLKWQGSSNGYYSESVHEYYRANDGDKWQRAEWLK
jgi:hypothetical protein